MKNNHIEIAVNVAFGRPLRVRNDFDPMQGLEEMASALNCCLDVVNERLAIPEMMETKADATNPANCWVNDPSLIVLATALRDRFEPLTDPMVGDPGKINAAATSLSNDDLRVIHARGIMYHLARYLELVGEAREQAIRDASGCRKGDAK